MSAFDSFLPHFRTGINKDLYRGGGLADVLESPSVLKILHAATLDCQSVYRDGVRMWNIFDTAGQMWQMICFNCRTKFQAL